jgi:hypothetical protein
MMAKINPIAIPIRVRARSDPPPGPKAEIKSATTTPENAALRRWFALTHFNGGTGRPYHPPPPLGRSNLRTAAFPQSESPWVYWRLGLLDSNRKGSGLVLL